MNLGCNDQSALGRTRDSSYALRRRYTGAVKRPQRTRGESLGIWTSPWWVALPFCSISMLGTACHHLCSLGTWDIRWGSVHSTLVTFSPFPITHYLPQIHPIPYIHRPIPITLKRWQEMWCGEGLILGSVIVCCPRGAPYKKGVGDIRHRPQRIKQCKGRQRWKPGQWEPQRVEQILELEPGGTNHLLLNIWSQVKNTLLLQQAIKHVPMWLFLYAGTGCPPTPGDLI